MERLLTSEPVALEVLWPLFCLEITTPRLVMRVGRESDFASALQLIEDGIHDPSVMPFRIPFTDSSRPERDRDSLRHWWGSRASFQPAAWNLEFFAFAGGEFIGAQAMVAKQFALLREANTGSWLGQRFQGQGYGTEMRAAILEFAFDHLDASAMCTEAFLDNAASTRVSRKLGYEPDGFETLAPRGVPITSQRYRLSREAWARGIQSRSVTVTGLDPCRALLGI
jgi:RimJ/RimL family protein N-acetyltransferase